MELGYEQIKEIVYNKLVYKTEQRSYEDLSELLYGEGNCFNESEVRKRMYGMKRLIEVIENEKLNGGNGIKTRILSLSDFHIPFQLPVETFADYVGRVDILQLNGDITDCQAISRFQKTYRISPMEEIIETRKYLIDLITYLKPKKVVITYGNHDIRFQSYLSKNLDTDILELMPKTSLELIAVDGFKHYDKRNGTKIEYSPLCDFFSDVKVEYTDNWYCQIGDAIFCHPYTFSQGMMRTAERAMEYFRNEGFDFNVLCIAHTHRAGQYKVGKTILYEQGCCCDSRASQYCDGNLVKSQKEGLVYLCQDENGNTIPEEMRLEYLN
jgi:predicted phosphodiesterase